MQHNENGVLLAQATDEQENYRMQKQPSWCQKNIKRDGKGISITVSKVLSMEFISIASHKKNKRTNLPTKGKQQ